MSAEAMAFNDHIIITSLMSFFHVSSPALALVLLAVVSLSGILGISVVFFVTRRIAFYITSRSTVEATGTVTGTTDPTSGVSQIGVDNLNQIDIEAKAGTIRIKHNSRRSSASVNGVTEEEMMEKMSPEVLDAYLRLTGRKGPVIPRGTPNIPDWPFATWGTYGPRPDCVQYLDEACEKGCLCDQIAAQRSAFKEMGGVHTRTGPSPPMNYVRLGGATVDLQRDAAVDTQTTWPGSQYQLNNGYAASAARQWGTEEDNEDNKGSGRWRWSKNVQGKYVSPTISEGPSIASSSRSSVDKEVITPPSQFTIFPQPDYRISAWKYPSTSLPSPPIDQDITDMFPTKFGWNHNDTTYANPPTPKMEGESEYIGEFVDVQLSPMFKSNRATGPVLGDVKNVFVECDVSIYHDATKPACDGVTDKVRRVKRHRQLRPSPVGY